MKTIEDLEILLKQIEETGAANFVDPINWRKFGPLLVSVAKAAEYVRDQLNKAPTLLLPHKDIRPNLDVLKAFDELDYPLKKLAEASVWPEQPKCPVCGGEQLWPKRISRQTVGYIGEAAIVEDIPCGNEFHHVT